MQPILNTDLKTAKEFLLLKRDIDEDTERLDVMKQILRGFGPKSYEVSDIGTVRVSQPSISRKTGTKLVVDETKIADVDPTIFATIVKIGLLRYEDVYSRASVSKVEAIFP